MRNVLLLASLMLVASAGCGGEAVSATADQQQRVLPLDEFVREFCKRINDIDPTVSATPDGEDRVTLQYGSEQRQTVVLGDAYQDYQVALENVDLILNRVVDANLTIIRAARESHIDLTQVLPFVVDTRYLEDLATSQLAAEAASPEAEIYVEPLNDQLTVAFYLLNERGEPRYLSQGDVASLAVPRDTLRELAVGNLHRRLPKAAFYKQYGITGVAAGDRYESCLLLIDELWTKEFFQVDGEIVVAVPSRNAVLVTGSNNSAGVEQLRTVARAGFEASDYPITDRLFVRQDGKWILFKP